MLYFAPKMIRWFFLALVLGFLTACGGGGGGGGTTAAAVVANFTVNPATPEVDTTVTFDGSSSTGSITNWSWTFDGSDTATGSTVTKTFTTAGDHVVSLTVSDGSGTENTTQQTITVSAANVAPTASFTADQTTVATGVTVNFDASNSSDTDGTIASYQWNFGGGTSTTATGQAASNTYTTVGTYTVSLTVTDDDGQVSTPVTQTIQVTAPFTSYTATQTDGMNVEFTVQPSASLGTVTNYEWVFGDGSPAENTNGTSSVSHTFGSAGNFTVDVTATSTNSQGASANFDVSVKNDVTKIIVIGDSISHGSLSNSTPSYRYQLWKKLVAAGRAVNFVGDRNYITTNNGSGSSVCPESLCAPVTDSQDALRKHYFDPEHQAQWGQTSSEALTLLGDAAVRYAADIAIVHIGTNDLALNSGDVAGASAAIDDIITQLTSDGVEHIFLAKIIPYKNDTNNFVNALNASIDTKGSTLVTVVDQNSGFNTATDLYDSYHPNASGELKMATKWYDALIAWGQLN